VRNTWLERRERVLKAVWTPATGISDLTADLPDDWFAAVRRLGHDLHVRQYGGQIDHIELVGEYDEDFGGVTILANVTSNGGQPSGLSGTGSPSLDSDQETIISYVVDSIQDSIGDAGIAWPWGDSGGFLRPRIEDIQAIWYDGRLGHTVARIGDLTDLSPPL
jgi:hypothetical protein